jgi:hypothetical protein
VWCGTAIWHVAKPLPPGTDVTGSFMPVPEDSLRLLTDVTSADHHGALSSQQSIHAATLALVRDARHFLVLDYFLFNAQGGPTRAMRYQRGLRPVAGELVSALRELKARQPDLPVLVLLDPINDYYRGSAPPMLAELHPLGVEVVVTRLDRLRDSNPVYSATWRLLGAWWLKPEGEGGWSNRLDAAGPDVRLGALLRILNFKANHRKVAITATADAVLRGIVSSGNPHDASSAHSNVALQLDGDALRPLLDSELAIAQFSGWRGSREPFVRSAPAVATAMAAATTGDTRAAIVTEGAIRERLVQKLAGIGAGDAIDIAMFYLSDRSVIEALLAAVRRGAAARVLLDPNKDAFGFEKSGIPNRQVAAELIAANAGALELRWIRTHGEQFHAKLVAARSGNRLWLMLGSANLTRRNLGGYNLEANVIVDAPGDGALARDVADWFQMLWTNRPGATHYSADAAVYAEPGAGRYWLYRFMEASGFSTF